MTWVHERVFAAGGEHIPNTWQSFRQQTGISAVLHLNPGRPQHFEGAAPRAFLWLDIDQEEQAGEEQRWLAGRFLQLQLEQGGSMLLHSGQGRHRTRWVYTAYLLLRGRTVESALRQVEEPPWLAPYHTDRARWHEFSDWLVANTRGGDRRSA